MMVKVIGTSDSDGFVGHDEWLYLITTCAVLDKDPYWRDNTFSGDILRDD